MGKIVAAGAEIDFLGDRRARTDFDFAQTVGVRAIAEAGAITQGEVPRNGDAGALVHEWFALDRGAEEVEPEKPPGICRLGRPTTKDKPAKFPEQTPRPVLRRPRRFVGRALFRLYRRFRFHADSQANQAERQPR